MPSIDGLIETGDLRRIKTLKDDKIRFVLQNRKLKKLTIKTVDFSSIPHLEFDLSYNKTLNHKELFEQLSELNNLKGLGLIKNAIKELPENIGKLTALETLELWSNGLKMLPSSFSTLKALTYLNLRNNSLLKYPDEINAFKKLKYLNLRFNKIKKLPVSFFNLKELEELDLSSCGITEIPPEIGKLTKLRILHLESNKLKTLPNEISKLKDLEAIFLKGNTDIDLEIICKLLSKLPKLISISFKEWKLSQLPESLGDMTQLESLNLEHNDLTMLPESLKKLKNIKEIQIQNNPNLNAESFIDILSSWTQMKDFSFSNTSLFKNEDAPISLPDNIKKLNSFESLFFQYARGLKNIPETIGELKQLKELHLVNTGISVIPGTLGKLNNLESLSVNSNPNLNKLPDEFYKLIQLKELHFSNNSIKLDYSKLVDFKNLEKLSVQQLNNDDFKYLQALPKLKQLYWSNEEITCFPDAFYNLKQIEVIRFSAFPNLKIKQEIDKLAKLNSIKELEFNYKQFHTFDWYIEKLQNFSNLEKAQIVTQDKVIPSSILKLSHVKELKIDIQGNSHYDTKDVQLPLEYAILPEGWIKFTRFSKVIKQAEEALITIDELGIIEKKERMIAFALLTGYYKPLFHVLNSPFKDGVMDGAEVYISGKPSIGTLKELKESLVKKGFKIKTKPDKVSHVLLNPKLNLKDIENIFNKGYEFFLEDHLKDKLIEEDTPYLLDESNEELISQITRLIKVKDEDQLPLILSIIEGGGANKLIISYLMAIHLFHKDLDIRKKSRNLFRKYASSELQNHVKNTWKNSFKEKELDNFKKIFHHDEIDLCAFILAFKMVRWHQAYKDGKIDEYFLNRFGNVYLEKVAPNQITESLSECDFIHTLRILPSEPLNEDFIKQRVNNLPLHTLSIEQSMEYFPVSFLEIPTLEKLTIGNWQASGEMHIPDLSQSNKLLKELSIIQQHLKNEENLKELTNLTRLNLTHTELSDISFIASFKQIQYLNLSNNQISLLPQFIESFSSLEYLSLDHNPLKSITIDFGKLEKLRSLNISECELNDLPDTFNGCSALYDVWLRNNNLTILPLSLLTAESKSYSGRNIYASNNKLVSIGNDTDKQKRSLLGALFQKDQKKHKGLTALRLNRISLEKNNFQEIPSIFFHFKEIRELNLQENKIENIPDNFAKLKANEIKLSKTSISEIPLSIFQSEASYISITSDYESITLPAEKDIPPHKTRIFIDGSEKEKEKMTNFRKALSEKLVKQVYEN